LFPEERRSKPKAKKGQSKKRKESKHKRPSVSYHSGGNSLPASWLSFTPEPGATTYARVGPRVARSGRIESCNRWQFTPRGSETWTDTCYPPRCRHAGLEQRLLDDKCCLVGPATSALTLV